MGQIINVIDVLENKITLQQAKEMTILHKGELYTFFDEGNTRHVFANADKTRVIKILQNDIGTDYNTEEVRIYENASDEDKANMVKSELSCGMVEQEFVTPIKFGGKRLTIPQKLFASKCRNEVGWDKDGNLVCYDLDEYMKY